MFGIGMPEMLLILAIALIVFGPKKLPELAKSLGRAFAEFRRATSELKNSIDLNEDLDEVKRTVHDIDREVRDAADPNAAAQTPAALQTDARPAPLSDADQAADTPKSRAGEAGAKEANGGSGEIAPEGKPVHERG